MGKSVNILHLHALRALRCLWLKHLRGGVRFGAGELNGHIRIARSSISAFLQAQECHVQEFVDTRHRAGPSLVCTVSKGSASIYKEPSLFFLSCWTHVKDVSNVRVLV